MLFRIRTLGSLGAALILLTAGCAVFTGPNEDRLTLEIAPRRVACMTMFATTCLQMRESADGPWQSFSGEIEGFTFEPGYHYVIDIERRTIKNPPADGSSVALRLIRIRSKTPE